MLSLGLIVWLLTQVDFAKEGVPILIAVAIGLVIYLAYRYFGRNGAEA